MVIELVSLDQVGPELKRIRKSKGLVQKEVAAKLELSVVTISNIEKGGNLSLNTLKAFEELYGCKFNVAVSLDPNDFKRLTEVGHD